MVYARANGSVVDGSTVVAVMGEGGQMVFGRATNENDGRVRISDETFPRHMVRGIVMAAHRPLEEDTAGGKE